MCKRDGGDKLFMATASEPNSVRPGNFSLQLNNCQACGIHSFCCIPSRPPYSEDALTWVAMCTRDNNSVLEELQLIRYSLLPDERIDFSEDSSSWLEALDKLDEDSLTHVPTFNDLPSVSIRIRDVRPTFNITYTPDLPVISVKGDISRGEQETWNSMVKERRKEFSGYE